METLQLTQREKINMREMFTKKEKKVILTKSNGVCAKCGKKLTVDTMTVEHVVPLSKGGQNHIQNLLALCEKCNQEKNNMVVGKNYYKYVDDLYKEQVDNHIEEYLKVKWFDLQTFFPTDQFIIPNYGALYEVIRRHKDDQDSASMIGFFKKYEEMAKNCGTFLLQRARYKDYKDVYNFCFKKYKKIAKKQHKKKVTEEFLNEMIKYKFDFHMNNGAIFVLRSKEQVLGVIFFGVSVVYYNEKVTEAITMETLYYNQLLSSNIIDDYISLILVRSIMKCNKFNLMAFKKINNGNSCYLDNAMTHFSTIQKCLEKGFCWNTEYLSFIGLDYDTNDLYCVHPDKIPDELCDHTEYFEKIMQHSILDYEILDVHIHTFLTEMEKAKRPVVNEIFYTLGYLVRKNDKKFLELSL